MAPKKHEPAKFKIGDKVWRIQFASFDKSHRQIAIFPGIVTAVRSGFNFDIYGYDYFLDSTGGCAHWECDLYATEGEAAAELIRVWQGNQAGVALVLNGMARAKAWLYMREKELDGKGKSR